MEIILLIAQTPPPLVGLAGFTLMLMVPVGLLTIFCFVGLILPGSPGGDEPREVAKFKGIAFLVGVAGVVVMLTAGRWAGNTYDEFYHPDKAAPESVAPISANPN